MLGGRASTRALANQKILFPLVWNVTDWSEVHASKELNKFVAIPVLFPLGFLGMTFSAFICYLTPLLLQKLLSL